MRTLLTGVSVLNLIYRDPARMIEDYLRYKR